MAQTREQIEAQIRADNPAPLHELVNGEVLEVTGAAYDAQIAIWVDNTLAQQIAEDGEAARVERRRQVRIARTRLQQIRDATSFTNAQRDAALRDLARIVDGIIEAMIDTKIIE